MYVSFLPIGCLLIQEEDHHIKQAYTRKHAVNLMQAILFSNRSTYRTILALDTTLRDDIAPPHLRIGASSPPGSGQSEEGLMIQRYMSALGRQHRRSSSYHLVIRANVKTLPKSFYCCIARTRAVQLLKCRQIH